MLCVTRGVEEVVDCCGVTTGVKEVVDSCSVATGVEVVVECCGVTTGIKEVVDCCDVTTGMEVIDTSGVPMGVVVHVADDSCGVTTCSGKWWLQTGGWCVNKCRCN